VGNPGGPGFDHNGREGGDDAGAGGSAVGCARVRASAARRGGGRPV